MTDHPPLASDAERALTELVRSERMRFALIQSIVPILFSPLAAAILAFALRRSIDQRLLSAWVAGLLVIALMRVMLVRSFRSAAPVPGADEVRRWERVFVASILMVDLWWGLGGLLLLNPQSNAEQALVFCFLMMMTGGHTASYSAHPPTVAAGALALALPITVRFALLPDTFHRVLAFAAVMFLLATFRSIKTLSYFFGRTHRLAYELEQERDRAERLARTDFLTGLANRRAFYEAGGDTLRYAARYRHPACLLLLDIDHFKAINDELGHAAGDAVLRELAALIQASLRRTDVAGRLGGEEFAVLLPETERAAAEEAAERLRQSVEAHRGEHEGTPLRCTVSIGVADLRPGDTLEDLIGRADEALYAAKEGGRNRVVLATRGVDTAAAVGAAEAR